MIHEFHLSPPGEGRGVSCDANGAFVGNVPLLKRSIVDGKERWEPRECGELSKALGADSGLPIDMSSKMGGVNAIANALNEGDVARAQIATVLLGIPDLPVLPDGDHNPAELIKCIRDLHRSGLLKADWDSDEHPRWPAGAPDSQGGQFAPKDDDATAGQTITDALAPRSSRDGPSDIVSSPRQRFYGADVTSTIQPALQADSEAINSIFDDGQQPSANDAKDLGIYASHGSYVGDVQVAGTGAIALDRPIGFSNPASWENLLRLPGGALKLGTGEIITAAALLSLMDRQREKAAIDAAFAKFGLDPTNAANVLAIRAYVWAQHNVPELWWYPRVSWDGPQLESVSQSIMALELARPGTLGLATSGDAQSKKYLDVAVEDGMQGGSIFESRARPADLPAALQTTIQAARSALNLKTNDQMQAHHLIPANVWGKEAVLAALAHEAGWEPNSITNLIALPANQATQEELAAGGLKLPIHSSSHPAYDLETLGKIIVLKEIYSTPTPAQARAIFDYVARRMEGLIIVGRWMPRLR